MAPVARSEGQHFRPPDTCLRHHTAPWDRPHRAWSPAHSAPGPSRYQGTGLTFENQRPEFCIDVPGTSTPDLPFKLRLWASPGGGAPAGRLSNVALGSVGPTGRAVSPGSLGPVLPGGGPGSPWRVGDGDRAWTRGGGAKVSHSRTQLLFPFLTLPSGQSRPGDGLPSVSDSLPGTCVTPALL